MGYENDPYVPFSLSLWVRNFALGFVFFFVISLIFFLCFRYRDEDGEPLMDFDDVQSDRELSPEPNQQGLMDDLEEEVGDWRERDRSQTPVYDNDSSSMLKSKPRKRLIKKSDTGKQSVAPELVDDDGVEVEEEGNIPAGFFREGSGDEGEGRKRKGKDGGGSGKKEKKHKGEKRLGSSSSKGGSKFGSSKKGFAGKGGKDQDGDVKEMWDTVAGGDSEVLQISNLISG